MAKDEGFQPPTQGPLFGEGDVDQTGQYVAEDGVEVPKGSVSDVTSWVGGDKSRAEAALKAENEQDEPRRSLVEQLERLVEE